MAEITKAMMDAYWWDMAARAEGGTLWLSFHGYAPGETGEHELADVPRRPVDMAYPCVVEFPPGATWLGVWDAQAGGHLLFTAPRW